MSAMVAGHICLDIFPGLEHLPSGSMAERMQPGRLILSGPARLMTGGPVSNTGLALHKLGIETTLAARVGEDDFGRVIGSIVESFGADLGAGLHPVQGSSTSYSIIISWPGMDRLFIHAPGANDDFGPEDIDWKALEKVDLFHFGYPPVMRRMYSNDGKELIAIFRRVKEAGVTTALDMTSPDPTSAGGQANWKAILADLLPCVDIFLPSFDELVYMLRPEEWRAYHQMVGNPENAIDSERVGSLLDELTGLGVGLGVIKLGAHGLALQSAQAGRMRQMGRAGPEDVGRWAGRSLWSACYEVRVAGTTGSGDATIAGFLAALMRGFGPEDTLRSATGVGACNVEAEDALSGLRTWEATQARIAAGWAHRPTRLDMNGWRVLEAGLWEREKSVPFI